MRTNWKKKYQDLKLAWDSSQAAFGNYRNNAARELSAYIGQVRRLNEVVAANNVTITELQNQVAVQASIQLNARSELEFSELRTWGERWRASSHHYRDLFNTERQINERLSTPWYVKAWNQIKEYVYV